MKIPDIIRKEDGKRFPVYGIIGDLFNSTPPNIELYCKDWEGPHMIGKDCEWYPVYIKVVPSDINIPIKDIIELYLRTGIMFTDENVTYENTCNNQ